MARMKDEGPEWELMEFEPEFDDEAAAPEMAQVMFMQAIGPGAKPGLIPVAVPEGSDDQLCSAALGSALGFLPFPLEMFATAAVGASILDSGVQQNPAMAIMPKYAFVPGSVQKPGTRMGPVISAPAAKARKVVISSGSRGKPAPR